MVYTDETLLIVPPKPLSIKVVPMSKECVSSVFILYSILFLFAKFEFKFHPA